MIDVPLALLAEAFGQEIDREIAVAVEEDTLAPASDGPAGSLAIERPAVVAPAIRTA